MNVIGRKRALVAGILFVICFTGGCGERRDGRGPDGLASTKDLGPTIGSLARLMSPEWLRVEGYGLVSGLKGTGSAECPPRIRAYLTRYIQKQLPAHSKMDVGKYINRPDTAVVFVEGMMPAIASTGQYFDVVVTALPSTQTTSLEDGWLFETELRIAGSFGVTTRVLADVKGPIFINRIGSSGIDKRAGYILAGGKALEEYKVNLALNRPDFRLANNIRDRLNERFGPDVAMAPSSGQIELAVPARYNDRKQRFVALVGAMYLTRGPEINSNRIAVFVRMLADSEDKYASEIALEAIGNECLDEISVLLTSPDERVRLHAARCMLNLGSDAGLMTLRRIAMDANSAYRLVALEAIAAAASRDDAAAISRMLLRDDDFGVRLAAYEQLRKLDDVAVAGEQIARRFYLERITQTEKKAIYASRSGQPRIVLFGAPISCHGNIFVGSDDGEITINAPTDAEYVTIIRKHPKRPSVITQLKSSFEVGDIVKALCEDPVKEGEQGRGGLGVSYADAIVLLKQMCDKGAVRAEFRAGPLPNFGLIVKK
ncbi:MAG: flagellar basal body P-ring protein FlgI [Planctomycetota bacterium]